VSTPAPSRPRSAVTVTYRYNCCAPGCGVFHEEVYDMWPGSQLGNVPTHPGITGWLEWISGLYCPKHKIKIDVDGDTFDL
jgi:hypothetical protein